jgi:hypothetical protein
MHGMSRVETTTTSDPLVTTNGQAGRSALREYLADRDAACPGCGYNLRAVTGETCPECGKPLALSLDTPDPLARRRGLLCLLLLWLLFAGSMNAYRFGGQARAALAPARQAQVVFVGPGGGGPVTITAPGQGPLFQVPPLAANGGTFTLRSRTASAGTEEIVEEAIATVDTIEATTGDPAATAPPAVVAGPAIDSDVVGQRLDAAFRALPNLQVTWGPPASGPRWSNVGWTLWAQLAGWTLLAASAAAGLAVLARYRRRPAPLGAVRLLSVIAWVGFGGYFAYHAVRFVAEVA